jgi:putative hydrolase of the HAD superfamily
MEVNKKVADSPRALLLDLDDTIVTDNGLSNNIWRLVCEKYAPQIEGLRAGDLFESVIKAAYLYWSDPENHRVGRLDLKAARIKIVNRALSDLGFHNSSLASQMAETFTLEKEEAIVPFPGALEVLSRLKASGLRMALITNGASETQRRKIKRFGLETFFDSIFIEAEFGVGKPDERIFWAALHKLSVSASEAWMVGDDLNRDIVGAKRLGIFSIWVDVTGHGLPQSAAVQPDTIIQSISQLVNSDFKLLT